MDQTKVRFVYFILVLVGLYLYPDIFQWFTFFPYAKYAGIGRMHWMVPLFLLLGFILYKRRGGPQMKFALPEKVKWNPEQIGMVDALNRHSRVLYRGPRRSGKSHAICGMIAHLMETAEPINIAFFVTSSEARRARARTIMDLYSKDDIYISTLRTRTANVHLVLNSEKPKFESPIDLWIVDDVDFQKMDLFFKYIVPGMMLNDVRVLMTHTEDPDSLKILKRTFHCISVSK